MIKILLILNLISIFAQAEVGRPGSISDKGPASICRIIKTEADGVALCTGSLVAPNQILTAAHCVEDMKADSKLHIECGYLGYDQDKLVERKTKSDNRLFTKGVNFSHQAEGKSFEINPLWLKGHEIHDEAIITLDRSLDIVPMKVNQLSEINEAVECFSAGYGINHQGTMGFLNVARLDAQQLRKNVGEYTEDKFVVNMTDPQDPDQEVTEVLTMMKFMDPSSLTYSVIANGDSGGPVFCKKANGSDFFQFGINRAMYYLRKQRLKSQIFDIEYTSAYSKPDLIFKK